MKKILSLAAALMATLSMMAVEPTFESYDWASQADAEAVAGDHSGVVVSYAGLGSIGNVSGHYYIPNNTNLKRSESPWKYFGVSASSPIDSIAILYCPNGSNMTNIAWVAWGEGVTPTDEVLAYGITTGTTSSKSWDNAIWETIDLSDIDAYTIYTSRSVREFKKDGSVIPNFGGGQTINILGVRVWVRESTPSTDPVATVNISGPTEGIKDFAASFSATTDIKADEYKWFVNDVEQSGATAKTFEFTPSAAGDYSIVCKARNDNNATGEWVASSPIVLKALGSLSGELIKATLSDGTHATVTGLIGGTADAGLSNSRKMDKGKYLGITLASGAFAEGDTVIISLSAAGQNYPCLFADKAKETLLFLADETSSDLVYKIVLPAAANGLSSLYFVRDADDATYKWNPTFSSVSVVRPKTIISSVESLTGVAVNGVAISSGDLTDLINNGSVTLSTGTYVDAPEVQFTKHCVYTYEGDTQDEKDVAVNVTASEELGAWRASSTIGGVNYTVVMSKAASSVVTYMDDETILGTENVAVGGAPTEYAQYQNKSLSTFGGWFTDAELTSPADMTAAISTATIFYAKFEDKTAESVNIEKAVMENGKGYDIIAQLGTLGYATSITGSLDSLAVKDDGMRNYAYLGLKVKQSGAMLNFRLKSGSTVKIKFGNVATTPNVSINEGAYAAMEITDKVYTYTAAADELISIKMMDGNAVVFQQIMIDEPLNAPELYAINCAEAVNGTLTAPFKMGIPGETVDLTVTPNDSYEVESVTVNGNVIEAVSDAYSFVMPAEDTEVTATFVESIASAFNDAKIDAKRPVKRLVNGYLIIEKEGVLYNAQGTVLN